MSEKYENICNICYEEVGDKNRCSTPCGHLFCFQCIMKSSKLNNTCPMCREIICESNNNNDDDNSYYNDDNSYYDDDNDYIEYDDVYCGRYDEYNNFHYPIVIRSIHQLCGVLRNFGFFNETCYDEEILKLILHIQEDTFEYKTQLTDIQTYTDIFVDIVKVYKRSILLNKHFQKIIWKKECEEREERSISKTKIIHKENDDIKIFILNY